jgi:hypothetical protein
LHTKITDDPDVAQAVEDKLDDLARIRDLIAADARAPRGGRNSALIGELLADVHLRAERLQVAPEALVAMVGQELDKRDGRRPLDGVVRRRLALVEGMAIHREREAHEALSRAQAEMRAATLARQHAQLRCAVMGIGARG